MLTRYSSSGIDLDGTTIGNAPLGAMCTSFSNAVTQDTGSSVASVGATAAHELGHIFDMVHDDGRKCREWMYVLH